MSTMVSQALSAEGVAPLVDANFYPFPATGRFGNCSSTPNPSPFDDCAGSRIESCMVVTTCEPHCPLSAFEFVSLYEGPYPEGPGSFKKCGGTASTCLQKAGFSAKDTSNIMKCVNDNTTAIAALKKMEAYGQPKFNSGKGFPQVYVDGKAVGGPILPAICASIAAKHTTVPAGCKTVLDSVYV